MSDCNCEHLDDACLTSPNKNGDEIADPFTEVCSWRPRWLIDGVIFPVDGIEINSAKVTYTITVQLYGGLQWDIKKRYSEIREMHKGIGERVKHLNFPFKYFFWNLKAHVLLKRRQQLEAYITELLEIRPFLFRQLYNFLGVYENIKSLERKHKRATNAGGVQT
ncbi:hypothetical protein CCR75_007826 [Bremia lactucae]|uniref:PX domain-containing protein n=1 Tax=Bremia lactucae TaxID=4779 RepID=A0A976FGY3_BRELC|nr:hypothetical protein CCR75_007826 [Bremia lactucae]